MAKLKNITVTQGDSLSTITVRISGVRTPIVCGYLGKEVIDSKEIIYLDTMIHNPEHDYDPTGWIPSGIISTILTKERNVHVA